MKHLAFLVLVASLVGCTLPAQTTVPPSPPPPPNGPAAVAVFTAEQLDQLLGPIALYPDALIAIILPASTNPTDIVLAARYLEAGGDPAQAEAQPWDESVQALAHYPQVIRWMDENLAWTRQLGEAFDAQPGDVMNAIQRLRARAKAAGTLIDTPQQQVVYEGGNLVIIPAQPDVIYVPYYDPFLVYAGGYHPYPYDYFGFSAGFATGWWLSYGLDWPRHRVWCIARNDRHRVWQEHHGDWFHHRDWDHDWDHGRAGPHRVAPPLVHTWRPRPGEHRRWPDGVAAARTPRFREVVRPTLPQNRWNEAGRPEDGRRDAGPRRGRTNPPTAGVPARADNFVGPVAAPQMAPSAPAVRRPAPGRTADRGERRDGFRPAEPQNRAPGYTTAAPGLQRAPEPRPAPPMRYATPAQSASPAVRYGPPAPRYAAPVATPGPRYFAPAASGPRYAAPAPSAPRYAAPAPQYSAPAPRYSAPAPHYSAPPPPPPAAPAQAPQPSGSTRGSNAREQER